jgi:hypothetical protein
LTKPWSRKLDKNAFIVRQSWFIIDAVMTKIKLALPLMVLLVIATFEIAGLAMANFTPYDVFLPGITIKKDGSVNPDLGFINCTGNLYTLTRDISNYTLTIRRSNIILDGKGHIINGSQPNPYETFGNGLTLDFVTNVTVKDIEITGFDSYEDLRLTNSSDSNIIRVRTPSIKLQNGYSNVIAENIIDNSLDMENAQNSTISKNVIGRLILSVSHNALVTENNITSIIVQFCDSNKYYRNNFLSTSNSFQYYFSNKESFWDNGSIGNYWYDYLTRFPNASEIGTSGIGNTPYKINQVDKAWINGKLVDVTWILGNVIDHYPLMLPDDYFAPTVRILSVENKLYDTSTVPLTFTLNELASHITYSLDGEENVTILENTTLTGLANGDHYLTVYASDKAGNIGASETVYFSVDVPFPTLVVTTVFCASLAVISVGTLIYFKKRKH